MIGMVHRGVLAFSAAATLALAGCQSAGNAGPAIGPASSGSGSVASAPDSPGPGATATIMSVAASPASGPPTSAPTTPGANGSSGAPSPSMLPSSTPPSGTPASTTGRPATGRPATGGVTGAPTTTRQTAGGPAPAPVTAWTIGRASAVPKSWTQQFLSAYGAAPTRLGSAPGGDSGTLTLGPEYAAQGPDGTWHVLDAAKRRVAHLGSDGAFLGAVTVPPALLADGYFQYQLPRVLADGSIVAEAQVGETSRLLRVKGASVTGVSTSTAVVIVADDGRTLYGFDGDNRPVSVNPTTGGVSPTSWFRTQAGTRYRVTPGTGSITVELPDSRGSRLITMPIKAAGMPGPVHPSVELAAGADGSLHLLVLAISETDESVQLAGYASVTADGVATPMEPMRDPTSPADPGSPAHLGIRYGASEPFLVFVDPQGLRVYGRAGG